MDWGSSAVADTEADIIRFGLTQTERRQLGLSLPDDCGEAVQDG